MRKVSVDSARHSLKDIKLREYKYFIFQARAFLDPHYIRVKTLFNQASPTSVTGGGVKSAGAEETREIMKIVQHAQE